MFVIKTKFQMDFMIIFLFCISYLIYVVDGSQIRADRVLATPEDFPYHGYMVIIPTGRYRCGAALIDKRHALTTASCAESLKFTVPSLANLILGSTNLKQGGIPYPIQKVHIHPLYRGKPYFHHDIAVLTLSYPVLETPNIRPIKLSASDHWANELVFAPGFGMHNLTAKNEMTASLHKLTKRIIGIDYCRRIMPLERVQPHQMCAYSTNSEGKIAECFGDSGSGIKDVRNELIGITSHVFPCALNYPDIYVKVLYYTDFINKIIKLNHK